MPDYVSLNGRWVPKDSIVETKGPEAEVKISVEVPKVEEKQDKSAKKK